MLHTSKESILECVQFPGLTIPFQTATSNDMMKRRS